MSDLHLVVGLADGRYAVPVVSVREVIRTDSPTPVPGAPPAVIGIVNLRGEILPILDGATLLESSRDEAADQIVVVEAGGMRAGLSVRRLFDVISLPLGLEETDAPALLGSSLIDGDLVGVVDVGSLLRMVGGPGVAP